MKSLVPPNPAVIFFSLSLCIPVLSMDQARTPLRDESVKKAIALLKSNGQIFETAFKLSMDSARTLLNTTKTPLSPELIEEAKRWVGSAVDLGKDRGWPSGIHNNKQFIALYFLRAAGYWLSFYSSAKFCEILLKHNPDDSAISVVYDIFSKFISEKTPEIQHEAQSEDEIAAFGEYPPIDYQGLMYGPWSDILAALEPFRPTIALGNPVMKRMTSNFDETILAIDKELVRASYFLIINDELITNAFDPYNSFGEDYDSAARLLTIIPDAARRVRIADGRLNKPYEDFEKYVSKLNATFNICTYLPKESPDNLKRNATKKSAPKRSIKKKKYKLAVQNQNPSPKPNPSDNQKLQNVEPQAESPVEISPAVATSGDIEEKENIASIEPEEVYMPTHLQYQNKRKPMKVSNLNKVNISPYAYNKYLPKEVVEVFLDILGNRNGDVRAKNQKSTIYKTKGWGTIKNLEDTLEHAGWLVNQKETAIGIQKEKHGSSTISFRMPNSENSITAIVLKFHNDHTIGETMREITRHFIVINLEYFGYTQEFLQAYYAENFCKEKLPK